MASILNQIRRICITIIGIMMAHLQAFSGQDGCVLIAARFEPDPALSQKASV
jgi:hypothetical protein